MPENVLEALIRMAHTGQIYRLTEPKLTADSDLALFLRLLRQQARSHIAGVHQDERRVEQGRNHVHLLALRPIGNRMKGCAKSEAAFVSAGM